MVQEKKNLSTSNSISRKIILQTWRQNIGILKLTKTEENYLLQTLVTKKKKNSSSCWESIAEREISWFHRNRNMRKCKYVGKYKEFKIFTYFIQLSLNLFKWLVTKIWKNLFYNLYLKVYNNKSVNIGILVIVTKYIIFN